MNKISSISQKFTWLFYFLAILYPLFVITVWMGGIRAPSGYFGVTRWPVDVDLMSIRLGLRISACIVDMIPTSAVVLSFYYLIKLFKLYAENLVFTRKNVKYIRTIGYTLIWQVVTCLLVQPILSLILTFDAPKGGHIISVGLSGDQISTVVIGGIVILISWIMEEARKLEEDIALTI